MKVPSVLNVGVCMYILTHTCIDHDVRPMGAISSGGGGEGGTAQAEKTV